MSALQRLQALRRATSTFAREMERRKVEIAALKQRHRALELLTGWQGIYPELRHDPMFATVFDAIDDVKDFFLDGDK
jgi:hypothetical protein